MPTIPSSALDKPADWQDLQRIALSAAKINWKCQNFYPNGSEGDKQHGVDIYGHLPDGRLIGIQCKKSIGKLRPKTILDEVARAETFSPPLAELHIATTATRGAADRLVRELTETRLKAAQFPVFIWGWNEIAEELAKEPASLFVHYPHLKPTDGPEKQYDDGHPVGYRTSIRRLPIKPWQLTLLGLGLFVAQAALVFSGFSVSLLPQDHPTASDFAVAATPLMIAFMFLVTVPGMELSRKVASVSLPAGLGVLEKGSDGRVYHSWVKVACPICPGQMGMLSYLRDNEDHTVVCSRSRSHIRLFDLTRLPDVADEYVRRQALRKSE